MYRAITRIAAERAIDPHDAETISTLAESTAVKIDGERVWANGVELTEGIYDADHADALPLVSAIPGVRSALVAQQRRLGEGGVVMAGRDNRAAGVPRGAPTFFLVRSLVGKGRTP